MMRRNAELLCFVSIFPVKANAVNTDSPVFGVSVNAFHAIVADFFGIEITAVAFSAADAFTIIKNALSMFGHFSGTPPSTGLYNSFERMVKLGPD